MTYARIPAIFLSIFLLLATTLTGFAQTSTTNSYGTVTAYHLNVRTTPTIDAPIVSTLSRGDLVPVIGRTNDSAWYQIILNGIPSWVSGYYLSVTNAHLVPVTYTVSTAVDSFGTVTAYHLNIRSTPSATAPIVGTLNQGDVVSVIGRTSDSAWYQILLEGPPVWVSGAYLSVSNAHLVPVTSTVIQPPMDSFGTVTAYHLNVRTTPSANAQILGTLGQGDVVSVVGRTGDNAWYQIQVEGGLAWVNGSYLSVTNSHILPIIAPNVVLVTGYVNTGALNIRTVPSPYFNQPITNVPRNTSLTIVGRNANGTWLKVSTTFIDVQGWVRSRYVTITSGDVNNLPIMN